MAVMMTPRESWTDVRLDDLKELMEERFDRVEGDIRELRTTMTHGFFALVGIMLTGFLALAGLIVF